MDNMDTKDNEFVVNNHHANLLIDEYMKSINYDEVISKNKEELEKMGKNAKTVNISKQKENRTKKQIPDVVKKILATVSAIAIFYGVGYAMFDEWALKKEETLTSNHPGVDIENVEDMNFYQQFDKWYHEQEAKGVKLNYDEKTMDVFRQVFLNEQSDKVTNPDTGIGRK